MQTPLTSITYPGDGIQKNLPIPFEYLDKSHVHCIVGDVEADFTWLSEGLIQLTTTPALGAQIKLYRKTSPSIRLVDFVASGMLDEPTLDTDSKQAFYLCQEANDRADESINLTASGYDAQGRRIINVGEAVEAGDAVNLGTIGYQYHDIVAVKPYVTAIESVAKDLTSLSLYEMDLGSVASPPSYNTSGAISNIKVVAEGMSYVQTVSGISADVHLVAIRAEDVTVCATNIDAIKNAALLVEVAQNAQTGAVAAKDAAAISATNAASSTTAAATSASSASASASTATTKATAAATSETNALASKNAAATSATNAATSETNALASKNDAATSAANAATSETNALTSKNAASTSATNAASRATAAATSATNAAASEANALSSKKAAATSETNAANSATAAAASATAAAASVGSVNDGAVTSAKLASTLDLGALP